MDVGAVISVNSSSLRRQSLDVSGFRVTHAWYSAINSAPHAHERAVCTVLLGGAWEETLAGQTHACGQGVLVAKPPGERHVDVIAAGTEMVLVEFEADAVGRLEPCARFLERPRRVQDLAILGLAWRIARELDAPDACTPLVVEGLALELLGVAARRDAARAERSRPVWLERARELIDARFHAPLRIADVARAVDVHPVRLTRGFRVHLGVSPGHYLRRARLDWAARELNASDHSLAEVAMRAGFADQSHFTRAFRRHMGLTPGQYRLVCREGRAPLH